MSTKQRQKEKQHGAKTHEHNVRMIKREEGEAAANDRDEAQLAHAAASEPGDHRASVQDEVTSFPSHTNRESQHNKHNNSGQEHHKPAKHGTAEQGG